jgi:hypothetical protein
MFGMIKRYIVLLVISLCIFSLSFHFVVEGLGGIQDHIVGQKGNSTFHSHDGDLFVLGDWMLGRFVQPVSHVTVTSNLSLVSEPLHPPFHPPRPL